MATVSEIRGELSKARPEEWKAFIEKYETDSRTGVIKLVEGCKRQIKKAEIENERLENRLIYEKKYYVVLMRPDGGPWPVLSSQAPSFCRRA